MITERDLDEAIAECQGKRKPDANDCIKLAAFYTIRDQLYGQPITRASFSAPPVSDPVISEPGDGELYDLIRGKKLTEVLAVFAELLDTLNAIHPRLHDAVVRKLS